MFGMSRQLRRTTLSRFKVVESNYKLLMTRDRSRCSTTWNHDLKEPKADQKIKSGVQKRWNSTQIYEGLSYYCHPQTIPLLETTVGQLFEKTVKTWPNRECIVSVHQGVRLTYSDILRRIDKMAAGLLKLGLEKNDRVGLWGPNDVEWFIAFMAIVRAGFIMVGINPAYQQSEIEYCINKITARAVIAPKSYRTQNYADMLISAKERCPSLEHIIIYSDDFVTGTRRFSDVESLVSNAEAEAIGAMQSEISPYDGCNIQFTSGTTGKPKATLLSHRSFVNNSRQGAKRSGLSNGEHKVCLNVPFFHAFGMIMGVLASFHAGATIVLEGPSYNPKLSVEAIIREKCTATFGTPTMWVNLIAMQEALQAPINTLQLGVTGGAPISPTVFRNIRQHLRVGVIQNIYGLTETTAIAFQSLPDESFELTENTVGHVSDNIEVKVVDENGSVVPIETPGELWVRGYNTMMRYWDDEQNTKKTITDDGWLKTGDQFCLRADGYGSVVGRLKEMIIRGGENIFPKEIEHFIESHPAVLEAHVFGVHDEVYGEEICACICLKKGCKLTKSEFQSYAKGRIASFKIPRYIEFLDKFPRTTSGKIQKFKLREELEERGNVPAKTEIENRKEMP